MRERHRGNNKYLNIFTEFGVHIRLAWKYTSSLRSILAAALNEFSTCRTTAFGFRFRLGLAFRMKLLGVESSNSGKCSGLLGGAAWFLGCKRCASNISCFTAFSHFIFIFLPFRLEDGRVGNASSFKLCVWQPQRTTLWQEVVRISPERAGKSSTL